MDFQPEGDIAEHDRSFETARLVVREPHQGELERMLLVYRSNPGYLAISEGSAGEPGRYDLDMLQRDLMIAQMTPGRQFAVVVERSSGDVVGVLDWIRGNPSDGNPWIGLAMTRADRQKEGFATEAVDGLIGLLRAQSHRVVRAGVVRHNQAGMRLVHRLGFELVARTAVRMVSEECVLVFERAL